MDHEFDNLYFRCRKVMYDLIYCSSLQIGTHAASSVQCDMMRDVGQR